MIIWVAEDFSDDHLGLWDCGTVGLWDSVSKSYSLAVPSPDARDRTVTKFNPSLARQASVRGIRHEHLGRLMIIWVGERFKPLLVRRAIVLEKEMITWVCGTVGLWRAFE